MLLQPHGPLFFGVVSWLQDATPQLHGKWAVIIDCSLLDQVDLSGAFALGDFLRAAKVESTLVLFVGLSTTLTEVLNNLHELNGFSDSAFHDDFQSAWRCALTELEPRLQSA